ncbi:MAG: LrgB family protein [Oceanospirillaceae bacterium]|nr:LrgB family protein [Oceanospirillaceae bacterium]MCP5350398.1 LrgB family protein [Oceanospirillaceae bacterium]
MSISLDSGLYQVTHNPLFGILLTLLSFKAGLYIYQRYGRLPYLHPVLLSVLLVIACLLGLGLSFDAYYKGAKALHWCLGPVIVALAVPLYENLKTLRRHWLPFFTALLLGGSGTIVCAVFILWLCDASLVSQNTMWSKSITTAIAVEVAPKIGGIAALAAAIVMVTGILAAVTGPWLLKVTGIHHPAAQGTALGVCGHAVGTARALEIGSEAGAFAALSMGIMGILCALLLPLIL